MKVLKDRGYEYGEHWGPHDIENREFGADAKSRKELAREGYEIDGQKYSLKFQVVPKCPLMTALRLCAKSFRAVHSKKLNAKREFPTLRRTVREWDDKRGCWKDRPLHDFTSHGADGFRYFAVKNKNKRKPPKPINFNW